MIDDRYNAGVDAALTVSDHHYLTGDRYLPALANLLDKLRSEQNVWHNAFEQLTRENSLLLEYNNNNQITNQLSETYLSLIAVIKHLITEYEHTIAHISGLMMIEEGA